MTVQNQRRRNPHLFLAGVIGTLCLAFGFSQRASAITRDSPEVKAAISRAVTFLESEKGVERRVGGKALVALALLKSGASASHPRVQEAAVGIRQALSKSTFGFSEMYTPGLSLIFLIEMESEQYAPEINKLLRYLETSQKPHGGWGYPDQGTGDTSMTQYLVLALWEASRSGFEIRNDVVERALIWLLKTRDPSGGFGYQGVVSDSFKPVPQERVRHGVALAGMASVYACADLLGFYDSRKKSNDGPPGLTRIANEKRSFKSNVDPSLIHSTTASGAGWILKNFAPQVSHWPYYYLYTLERYFSFRELAEGGKPKQLANWYDLCGNQLLKAQAEDGSWHDPAMSEGSAPCDTAWGILFLLRSMKKSIERKRSFGTGTLVGGRGLPKDSDMVKIQGGKVVNVAEASELQKVLDTIGEGNEEDYAEAIGVISVLPPGEAKVLISQQAAKLRELAGGTSADKRLIAVKALSRAGTLDDVTTLIYVLTDPEPDIVLAARDGLRRISRKIHGFKMPDDFDEGERRSAIDNWKAWYLAIRPDAEFE